MKPPLITIIAVILLSLGLAQAGEEPEPMVSTTLVSCFKKGDAITFFNVANRKNSTVKSLGDSPSGKYRRLFFTKTQDDNFSPSLGMTFYNGYKLDDMLFTSASAVNLEAVTRKYDIGRIQVSANTLQIEQSEIMNSVDSLRFTLTLDQPPFIWPEGSTFGPKGFKGDKLDLTKARIILSVNPAIVPNGKILAVQINVRAPMDFVKENYTVKDLTKIFQNHAKFYHGNSHEK